MGGITPPQFLVLQAHQAGLTLSAESGQLHIQGPKTARPLAEALLARKAEVLAYLEQSCTDCRTPLYFDDSRADGRCRSCRGLWRPDAGDP
jgi:hypothetical protein